MAAAAAAGIAPGAQGAAVANPAPALPDQGQWAQAKRAAATAVRPSLDVMVEQFAGAAHVPAVLAFIADCRGEVPVSGTSASPDGSTAGSRTGHKSGDTTFLYADRQTEFVRPINDPPLGTPPLLKGVASYSVSPQLHHAQDLRSRSPCGRT